MSALTTAIADWRRSLGLVADKFAACLDEFARCLGYDWCSIMSKHSAQYVDEYRQFASRKCASRFIVALGYIDRIEYAFMFDEDGKFLCIDELSADKAAKLIYKTLDAGKKLNVMDKQLVSAEDVPKFMIDCVIDGLAQECE